ncbi:MAG: hypothetical protein GX447_00505 [Elusimicrobia bacterium]|nr:hypothetical protein [Elusimicrobiota bacterium]
MIQDKIENFFKKAQDEGSNSLNEYEVYEIFSLLGLNLPEYHFSPSSQSAQSFASAAFEKISSQKIVIKIVSRKTLHKTESGGVKIVYKDKTAIEKAASEFLSSFKDLDGLLACSFLEHSPFALGEELLLGARKDDAFGPILTIGPGGTNSEGLAKALKAENGIKTAAVETLINRESLEDFFKESWILDYCRGKVRGSKKIAEDGEIIKWAEAFVFLMKNFNDYCGSSYSIEEIEVNPLCAYKGKFYALDGVLRFSKSSGKKRLRPSMQGVGALIKPQTVAVVGVSEKKMNMARIILNNVAKAGFPKDKIFAIKEGVAEIDSIKCYPKIKDIPMPADLYVVAVPSEQAAGVIEEAAQSGKVKGVVLISGGMGEKEGSEKAAQKVNEVIAKARENNPLFCLSGGNSLGLVLNKSKVNTLFIPEYKMKYPIGENPNMSPTAFVSQSGAFVISALSKMPQIKPLYSITVGNQQDVTVVDYCERLIEEDIKTLLVYIEGFKYLDGLLFLKIIEKAVKKGINVLVYKAGRTSAGQKAVMGHTASIAGDYIVGKSLMEKAGALVCEDFAEFCDLSYLFSYFAQSEPKNSNVFFMSNAGFESAGMADSAKFSVAAEPDKNMREAMNEILKKGKIDSIVDVKNPLDVTPMADDDTIASLVFEAVKNENYSSAVISMVPLTAAMHTLPKGGNWPDNMEEKSFLVKAAHLVKEYKKPILFCVAAGELYESYRSLASSLGFVVFSSADQAVKMLEKYLSYRLKIISAKK